MKDLFFGTGLFLRALGSHFRGGAGTVQAVTEGVTPTDLAALGHRPYPFWPAAISP